MSPLFSHSQDPILHYELRPLFVERVKERIGTNGDSMELAFRRLACTSAGVANEIDLKTSLSLQCEDGGWEVG